MSQYVELKEELDKVMADLEKGDLDIDEAVRSYERGLKIVKQLEEHLRKAENTVTRLQPAETTGTDEADVADEIEESDEEV